MIRRGEVRWARLPNPSVDRRQPVLIVSSDAFNASRIDTVIAAVITSRLELARAPGNVVMAAEESGLARDAVVNVAQVVTLDRKWVGEAVGRVPEGLMRRVVRGLVMVQDLRL